MNTGSKGMRIGLAALAAAMGFTIASALMPAQSHPSQPSDASTARPAPKTAGEAFKNVKVLKDIPASQLDPTMDFIADSLGVRCGYCHMRGDFSKDTKHAKVRARQMIAMELAINKANFNGHPVVTCYTCHRGLTHPVGIPAIPAVAANVPPGPPMQGGNANSPAMPTANQILQKYGEALGGAAAMRKISSRVGKGTFSFGNGPKTPLEMYAKVPDKLVLVMSRPNGQENDLAYDGQHGWMGNAAHAHPMRGSELRIIRGQARLDFSTGLKQSFRGVRPGRPEMVGGHEAYVLFGFNPGQPPTKLYFDEQTGLLLRVERYIQTPLGRDAVQTNYADYRQTDGVKAPYRWTIAQPGRSITIEFDQIQQNVPVDDAKFAMPPAPAGQKPPSP